MRAFAWLVASAALISASAPGTAGAEPLLLDRDGGLTGPRGQAARTCLYLFERDQAIGLIRSG